MKSLTLLFMLCGVLLTLSESTPRMRFAAIDTTTAGLTKPDTQAPKAEPLQPKMKATKIPRWHRLIPGMFS